MKQGDIVLVDLNPVKGSEQSGIRPCVIIQNNFANQYARTFVVAILTTVIKQYPHTLIVNPDESNRLSGISRIDLLQVRTVDQSRMVKSIGALNPEDLSKLKLRIRVAFEC